MSGHFLPTSPASRLSWNQASCTLFCTPPSLLKVTRRWPLSWDLQPGIETPILLGLSLCKVEAVGSGVQAKEGKKLGALLQPQEASKGIHRENLTFNSLCCAEPIPMTQPL